jgi:hypothetical protein
MDTGFERSMFPRANSLRLKEVEILFPHSYRPSGDFVKIKGVYLAPEAMPKCRNQ